VVHDIAPQARKIGVVTDDNFEVKGQLEKLQAAALNFGLALTVVNVQTPAEIAPAIAALTAARVEAVQFMTSPFLNSTRATFIAAMTKMKLPAMYEWPETVEEGGLVSYAPRISLCYRHVAVLVSKVLRAPGLPICRSSNRRPSRWPSTRARHTRSDSRCPRR